MNTPRRLLALGIAAALLPAAATRAQPLDPDPDIFDANKNGAGLNGAPMPENPNASLGGNVSVVNESALPPLGTIDIDLSGSRGGIRSGSRGGPRVTTSSSSMGIPRGSSSGGSQQQGNNDPFSKPPPGAQSSQSDSQTQSRGRMPESAQQSQSQNEGQSGEIPEGMKPSDESGEGSPIKGKLPEPPPEAKIGDPGMQIDPNGELAQDGEPTDAEAEGQASSQTKNRNNRKGQSQESDQAEGSDDQEMPDDMGNGTGPSGKRGSATVDDVGVPSNI